MADYSDPSPELWKIVADARRARLAINQAALVLARRFGQFAHRVIVAQMSEIEHRRHRHRCATCNPAGFATSLTVDGHEYRRRQLARRRRRR